jgi:hypothetical protein
MKNYRRNCVNDEGAEAGRKMEAERWIGKKMVGKKIRWKGGINRPSNFLPFATLRL